MRYRLAAKGRRPRIRLTVALALLFVLLGLLLAAGGSGCGCGTSDPTRAVARELLGALQSAAEADRALEAGNFGTARAHVRMVRDGITEALARLPGGSEKATEKRATQ